MGVEYGGFRVPDLNYEERFSLIDAYFNGIEFTQLPFLEENDKELYIDYKESIFEKIDKYAVKGMNDEYYLNIPNMANDKNELFKYFLPSPEIVKKYKDDLDTRMKSGERPNIMKYFLIKEKKEEHFLNALNNEVDDSFKLKSPETILNKFLTDIQFCWYPNKKLVRGKYKDQYWTFSDFDYQHSGASVYKAFCYFAQKWCTLYLIGADFIKFKNERNNWPSVTNKDEKITLPEYLSEDKDITKELNKAFDYINTGDFIPLSTGDTWDEIAGVKYFLKKFKINTCGNVYHKDICYSFCIPILYNNIYSDCNKAGIDVIKNILLRHLEDVEGLISKNIELWKSKINYFLEGTSRKLVEGRRILYAPTPFEFRIVIEKAWGLRYGFLKIQSRETRSEYPKILLTEEDYQNLRHIIIKNFKKAFINFEKHKKYEALRPNWKKFLRMINNADVNTILRDLKPYEYHVKDKQQRTKSNLFKNYCKAMGYNWNDPIERGKRHTFFQQKVQTFLKDVFREYENLCELRKEDYNYERNYAQ